MSAPAIPNQSPPSNGPTAPLPPVARRRWPRPLGHLFFGTGLLATALVTPPAALAAIAAVLLGDRGGGSWKVTRAWAGAIGRVSGMNAQVSYEAPLPEGPCIFVCNHQGTMDIIALFVGLGAHRRFVFAAKKEVFRIPFLGWFVGAAGYIKVDRADRAAAVKSLQAGGELIRGGRSVVVFPEGTRSRDGSILPFKKGPFMLALHAGVPIVPVAIEGSLQMNPRGSLYLCPNPVRMLVGAPIPTSGLGVADRDDLIRRVRSSIIRQHRRLGGLGGDEHNAIAASGLEGIGRPESAS